MGVFDTVKSYDDKIRHDLSVVNSIQHFRQALALNENRKLFSPRIADTPQVPARVAPQDMTQAWFLGVHGDIGGGAKADGLSLYPRQ